MLIKILIHLLIGGAITASGFVLALSIHYTSFGLSLLSVSLMSIGIGYAVISVSIILVPFVIKDVDENKINRGRVAEKSEIQQAQDDLIRYKKLLHEGIISQEEFTKKSEELKKKIL